MEEEERIFRNYIFVDTNRVERFFTAENAWLLLLLFKFVYIFSYFYRETYNSKLTMKIYIIII